MNQTLPRSTALDLPATARPVRIYWSYVVFVSTVHLLATLAFWPWFFSWSGLVCCLLGLYVFGTLGINLGYHRLLTHRSLAVPLWLERLLATLAMCCLQDSPARWVAIHRLHHQHSDDQPDPHSPLVNLFWGHMGWIFVRNQHHDKTSHFERYARDVLRDPYYLWCERNLHWFTIYLVHAALYFLIGLGVGWLVMPSAGQALQFGASILVWGCFVRTVLVWHITWSVNSLGHLFGYQNYATGDGSRNNVVIGLVSNGDGWHNNHHAFQRCAAHGHKWWELDVTYATIRLLEFAGLATNVVRYPLDRKGAAASAPPHGSARETNLDAATPEPTPPHHANPYP